MGLILDEWGASRQTLPWKPSTEWHREQTRPEQTMELRVTGGKYEGKKLPPLGHYIDRTIAEDAQKELGIK